MKVEAVQDIAGLTAWHAVESASMAHDHVALPADPLAERVPTLDPASPMAGEKSEYRVGWLDGSPAGAIELNLPTVDNLIAVSVTVHVLPELRRRGLGRELLQHALDETATRGRPRVFFEVPSPYPAGPAPAAPLLRSVGARPVLKEVRRLLDLSDLPDLEAPIADGYRFEQWVDVAPEELVEGLAHLCARMSTDAPLEDMDWEPEIWDAARYRRKEASAQARGRVRYAGAAVHVASGQVVAMTDIGVSRHHSEVAYQWDTIVLHEHRGHGLGLALKARNHELLVKSEPATRWVNTWNAESNTHMVGINERLGFRPVDYWTEWQLDR
ncbi:MAG: GCN5-related N-acetyltransferase [Frankiales bacterium]|nr:GCN5-related N-acetyltransferase [Frankiales bacterium]